MEAHPMIADYVEDHACMKLLGWIPPDPVERAFLLSLETERAAMTRASMEARR